MNVDEKRVEKCYPTMQELEGIQWNNWEEHLNVQNYRIFTFQRALHKIVAFLMVWLYGEQKCESFEKGKATITEIMFGNGHEAPTITAPPLAEKMSTVQTAKKRESTPGQRSLDTA